jgi:hypothetical protein
MGETLPSATASAVIIDDHPTSAVILRAPMRSRTTAVPAGAGADFGIANGLVGIGEALDSPPRSLAEAILALRRAYGDKAGRMLARFAELPDGAFVWTRQQDGAYRLGRIRGDWRYDDSPAARAVGIHQVRSAAWAPARFDEATVPDAVARTFARGGRNLQHIHGPAIESQTLDAWRDT